jgi:alanine racemase
MRATRAVIYLDNLKNNIRQIKTFLRRRALFCLAVKADAYGHGLIQISKAAVETGIDYLAVATVQEGEELRDAGIRIPILLYSLPIIDELAAIAQKNIIPMVSDFILVEELNKIGIKQAKPVSVHLKIDTGMGRIGCKPDEAKILVDKIRTLNHIKLEGVSTHFPSADLPNDPFTVKQIETFSKTINNIEQPGITHAANSGGLLYYPDSYFDMVRPGLLSYGYYPHKDSPRLIDVKPVMQLESQIVFIKRVPAGTPISYGRTYITNQDTIIGTIPIGYGDGYPRSLSNISEVYIKGKRYPAAGRICMDQFMVDLGPQPDVSLYDKVILFGSREGAPDAQEVSEWAGTIPYEITCSVSKRVPRIYL